MNLAWLSLSALVIAIAVSCFSQLSVAAHLVDVSPLSTIGALCLAAIPATQDPKRCSTS